MEHKRIEVIYFNAGGGHRAAALALRDVIALQGRPWSLHLRNLMELIDPQGRFRRVTGMAPEDLYNMRLKRGWTLGLRQELRVLQRLIRLAHPTLVRRLAAHWHDSRPDLVVSLVPNFNRALYDSMSVTVPRVPFVTVMTDLADLPPHFWIEPGQRQHLVCGTAMAVQQALEAGYEPNQVSLTSGMVLRPSFYRPTHTDRSAARQALGLEPSRPTAVVMFGGHGSKLMLSIARMLDEVQLILMCGHNRALADGLRSMRRRAPHAVIEFTADVCEPMRLGDFFIGKPGPGSLSEAIHLGLPVLTLDNAWTMPQERYNARWVRQRRLGIVVDSTHAMAQAAKELIQDLPYYQEQVRQIKNRAVFEVVDTLARVVDERQSGAARLEQDSRPTLFSGQSTLA